MATAQLGTLLRHIHTLAGGPRAPQRTDRQLLEDFAARGDESAFTALVARHGPMVLRVCRRVLGHEQDAEDSFQATFLVLARNAASIRKAGSVADWLHGVAYRTAMKARRGAARRRNHEARLRERAPEAAPGPSWDEVQAVLDEEVRRLPEPFRAAFTLCVLEGKSGPQAAAELGCREGTVASRVGRARQHLRRRLARRGIKLSALPAALLVGADGATAAVPAWLAETTVRSGLLVAAGGPAAREVPARVVELATGVTRGLLLTKGKVAALLLLTAASVTVGVLARQAGAAQEKGPEAPAPQAKPPAAKEEPQGARTFAGRVLGPDGQPVAGATVSVWAAGAKKEAARAREATGKDGRFRVTARRADLQGKAVVVATAEGCGPDWAELSSGAKDGELTLRLARDDVPITGRLRNLEGGGVAGVVVQVRRVEKRADGGDLEKFIATKQRWARGDYVNGPDMSGLPAEALSTSTSATTDADGRFRLSGFGRERVVHLQFGGGKVEPFKLEVLTRAGLLPKMFTGNENDAAYGATFERLVPPCKAVVGTVREKGTGKPAAGVTVACGRGAATTDAAGRYRIDGVPKQKEYTVTVRGVPYFDAQKWSVADTPGFEPVGADFDLERGLAIRGRAFDKKTGKPVRGTVTYHAFADNPHLKNITALDYPRGRYTNEDGSFAVTGLPGPGALSFLADEDDYLKVGPPADWKLQPGVNTAPPLAHALVRIDPSEKDGQAARFEIALEPAATVKASVVDPDGQPLKGYYVAGLTGSPRVHSSSMLPQWSATCTFRGLDVRRPRTVVVFSPEKKLAAVQVVRGDEAAPLRIPLRPLSSLTGRVVGADGSPRAGLRVAATLSRTGEGADRLPIQLFFAGKRWLASLQPKATTGADGKFRLDGLLPGVRYTLAVHEGEADDNLLLRRDGVSPPEAGRNKDLGDVVLKPVE